MGKQINLYDDNNDNKILIASIFFPLLRSFIYFLIQSDGEWVEKYVKPLLQYREAFDFCSFVFFIITIYLLVCKDTRKSGKLVASTLLNFINTITCWDYAPDLWARIQQVCLWLVSRLQTSEVYVVGFGLVIFLIIVFLCWRRWKLQYQKIWNSFKKGKSCIYWLILFILGFFFIMRVLVGIGYSAGFKVTKIQELLNSSFGVLAIISVASMIYICIHEVKERKDREDRQTEASSVIFVDICLSLWGMASIRFYNGKLVMSGKAFRNLILAEIEIVIASVIILAGVLLCKGIVRYLDRDTGLKIFVEKEKRFQFAICVSGFIIFFVFIALIIIFAKWGKQIDSYFNGLDDSSASMKEIMGLWSVVILFVIVGIIVLGGISLFIYEIFQAILKKEKRPSEWIVLLTSFVLTGLSLYIYYKIEPKDKMNEMADDVAGVFALPVVLMIWYVIMTGLLSNLFEFLKDQGEIKDKLRKEMKNLILDSISAIFAPFYFSANYLATLREAILDDTDETYSGSLSGLQKCLNGGKKCSRACYIWLKKCFKKGRFRK